MSEAVYIRLALAIFLLLLSAFFSGAEAALFSLRRVSSKMLSENHFIRTLMSDPKKLLVTIFTGNDLANSTLSAIGASIGIILLGYNGEWIAAAVTLLLVLLLAEVLPRKLAFRNPEAYATAAAPVLYVFSRLAYPFYVLTTWASYIIPRRIRETASTPGMSEKDIMLLLKEGTQAGAIDKEEMEILMQVLQLDRIRCSDIMTPKKDVEMLSYELTSEEVEATLKAFSHSRFPVFQNRPDNIVGILYLKDFASWHGSGEKNWHVLLKKPYFVPEVKKVISLLEDFRRMKTHIAIVVDEFGTYTGIITLGDIIYTLFSRMAQIGEGKLVKKKKKGYLIQGDAKIELLRKYGIELPTGDFETVSGFAMHVLGRIPSEGDEFTYKTWKFRIESMKNSRTVKEIYAEKVQ